MQQPDDRPRGGKDLRDLRNLSRRPLVAFLQKQGQPPAPRGQSPGTFQQLRIFLPSNLWGWITDYLRYRIGRKHPFPTYTHLDHDNGIHALAGDGPDPDAPIRMALAGDWGTGTDEAFRIAERITAFKPHYSIHLGDVYFVGDPAEVRANFLGIRNPARNYTPCLWPRGAKATFALNGNHEMYARGAGYFRLMLPTLGLSDGDGARGQTASFFCLENEFWRVIALDTGYNSIGIPILENFLTPDCALPAPLMAWLRETVFPRDDRRGLVLLGHHQYYSRFDSWYPKQAEQLAEFITRPVLWFWGHEHRLAIYEKFRTGAGIEAFGRCIGHGGMPVDPPPAAPKHPECKVEFTDARKYVNDEQLDVGVNGFAQLTFSGATLAVDYVDIEGAIIFTETWHVDADGQIARRSAEALIS